MAMQTVPVTPGEGLFAAVRQVTAPAGTAFIYDARLWHRACPELNLSESWRVAVLNCVLPRWITPMLPRDVGAELFMTSHARDVLSPREVRDVEAMCCMGAVYEGPNSAVGYQRKARNTPFSEKMAPEAARTQKKQSGAEAARTFDRGAAGQPKL